MRRISKSTTIFPECSSTSESGSVTNSLYQSGDGLPGPEFDEARTEENTQIHTVMTVFAEDMHGRDLRSKLSVQKNKINNKCKKGPEVIVKLSSCVRSKIYQHLINE